MNHKLLFNTALLAGEIMLRNGAETYRVEDTINRILNLSNFRIIESFVTPTGIFATLDDPKIEMITFVKRVKNRTIHLSKVAMVNDVSRKLCFSQISLEEAYRQLQQIQLIHPYTGKIMVLAFALASGFFSIVFGGNYEDFIVSTLNGFLISLILKTLGSYDMSRFFIDLVAGFIIGSSSLLCLHLINAGNNIDTIIVGSIMPLVPGVAITNAVRDTIQGDLVSGISRALEALIIAISIAVGIGTGLSVSYWFLGGSM
ncbi:MAG: threonine/serine exporter ThrE family protein [Eubacteriales bacterium]